MSTEFRLRDRYIQDFMKTTEQDIQELKNDNLQLIQKVKDQEKIIDFLREENKALLPLYEAKLPKDKAIYFMNYICGNYKVSFDEVMSNSRKGILPYVRQISCYFLSKYFDWSIMEIRSYLICDRTMVIHNIQKIEGLIDVDRSVLRDVLVHRDWLKKLNEIT